MLRIAICEDKPEHINMIKTAVENYFSESESTYNIFVYDNPLKFLENLPKISSFDILLLDICMPGILGTDVAREIRKRKDKTEIIFLTTSKEFAIEAFALDAAHYIVKPFSQMDFNLAMNKAMLLLAKKETKTITLKVGGSEVRTIDLNEISFVECFSHTQTIYLTDGESFELRQTLTELLKMFENELPGQFVVPYKGYIVNQKQIRQIADDQIHMRSKKTIPIPKRSSKEIANRYFDWCFRGERS